MVHEQAIKIDKMMEGLRSKIAFMIHDAVIIDLADEDRYDLPDIMGTFSNTRFGHFKTNLTAGKDLGNMKGLKL